MNAPPNHPGKNARNNGEIKLHGTSICPGFAIGRIHVVDADISIPQNRVDAGRIASEQKRYTLAVEAAKQHLRNHVESMHSDSSIEAQAIFKIHQAILVDESFHDLVRNRIGKPAAAIATRDILSSEVSTK